MQTWLLYHNALSRGVEIEDILKYARKSKEKASSESETILDLKTKIAEQQKQIQELIELKKNIPYTHYQNQPGIPSIPSNGSRTSFINNTAAPSETTQLKILHPDQINNNYGSVPHLPPPHPHSHHHGHSSAGGSALNFPAIDISSKSEATTGGRSGIMSSSPSTPSSVRNLPPHLRASRSSDSLGPMLREVTSFEASMNYPVQGAETANSNSLISNQDFKFSQPSNFPARK